MKVAKLVTVSLMTRVVVEDNASDEQIVEAARINYRNIVENELWDNLEDIKDDTEVPYGSKLGEI